MKKRIIRVVITALVCAGILIWDKHENKKMREHYEQVKYDETQTEATTVDMEFGYYKNNDGLWVYNGITYKNKFELSGEMAQSRLDGFVYSNKMREVKMVVLSNRDNLTFEDVSKEKITYMDKSSSSQSYEDVLDFCIVEMEVLDNE